MSPVEVSELIRSSRYKKEKLNPEVVVVKCKLCSTQH